MYCSRGSHSSWSLRIRLQYEQMGSRTSSCSISLRRPRMRSATLSRARSSSGSTGLAMKSSAPASMPAKYCCLPPRDVTRMKYTYGSRVRARIRRHSSGPSISGMYQSEITMGTRASCSSSHASLPLGAPLTSYPAAFASAPSCALDTGSSSTTITEIRLGIRAAFRCRSNIVEHDLRLPPYVLELVSRAGRPRFLHGAPEGREIHRGRGRSGGVGGLGAPPFDGAEQVVRLERLREIPGHPTRQTALALAAEGVGGQGDDRQRPALR